MNAQLLLFYAIWLALISGAVWTWVREGRELRECRALHAEFEELRARARAILREYQRQAEHCPGCQCNPNADLEGPYGYLCRREDLAEGNP